MAFLLRFPISIGIKKPQTVHVADSLGRMEMVRNANGFALGLSRVFRRQRGELAGRVAVDYVLLGVVEH